MDTCIWRDFYEDRISRTGRELGKEANKLIQKILGMGDTILYAESIVWELRKDYDIEEIEQMLKLLMLSGTLKKISIRNTEQKEARRLSSERELPFIDCLHAVLARNHNAELISQDKHIIEALKDIAKTSRP